METIKAFKELSANVDKNWALEELRDFLVFIKTFKVDDVDGYSNSFKKVFSNWHSYIHEKLNKYDFQNGKPEENTFEKRPKAKFWLCIYCTFILGDRLTSREVKEKMVNTINKAINYIKEIS
jgi:hypothetical protein